MAHTASYYWAGKVPAAQFMTVVPFGLTHKGAWSWIYAGGGLALWQELYEPSVCAFSHGKYRDSNGRLV